MGKSQEFLIKAIHANMRTYRKTQVTKYNAEKRSDYHNYSVSEKYKNRVRVVDIFLGPAEEYLESCGIIGKQQAVQEIP